MSVLVTGVAGFVGSNLADKLINLNEKVYGIDNFSTGKIENVNSKVEFIKEDLANTKFDKKIDIIYHIAALARIGPSLKNPKLYLNNNLQSTISVLEIARKYKAKVIFAGSSSAYFDVYANPYSFSKWASEEIVKLYSNCYKISGAIARFYNVYGPRHCREGDNACALGIWENQKLNNQSLTITGTGAQRRDWTHVDDIINGLLLISEKTWCGEIFNLGRGENKSVEEVVEWFEPKGIEYIPARKGEAFETLCDCSLAHELGWKPQINLKDYVKNFLKENNL